MVLIKGLNGYWRMGDDAVTGAAETLVAAGDQTVTSLMNNAAAPAATATATSPTYWLGIAALVGLAWYLAKG